MMKKGIVRLTDPQELPGKISARLFRTARPSLAVSGKIILAALRYFSRKPCITGVGRCNALVVHRAAKPGYSIINLKRNGYETGNHDSGTTGGYNPGAEEKNRPD